MSFHFFQRLRAAGRLLLPSESAASRPLSSFFSAPEGTTLSRQGELARYGVPDLRETGETLLATTGHLLTDGERAEAERKVRDLVEGEDGRRLHRMLEERAREKDNWVRIVVGY